MRFITRGAPCLLAALLAATSVAAPTAAAPSPRFSHAALDTVLARYLHDGSVDYGALRREHGALDRYLVAVAAARPDGWPREEQIAFWVNAYNARVLEAVIRRPGLESVMDVGRSERFPGPGFFREPRPTGGAPRTLEDVEKGILRARFHEPRVHFVLNCASRSCPVLPERALRAATLEADLESATRRFLTDETRNRIEPRHALRVSAIFDWYGEDFRAEAGSVQGWIERHWPGRERFASGLSLHFLPYDWALNGHW